MKKRILLLPCLFISYISFSQTVLWQENFEGTPDFTLNTTDQGSASNAENLWVINNVYAGGSGTFFCPAFGSNFPYTVPPAPNQPAGITNNPTSNYLHITPQIAINSGGNMPAASYVAADGFCIFGGQNAFARMSSDINTMTYDSISLDLWWMCGGSTLYYGQLYYSTDSGSSWTSVINSTTGTNFWMNQATWINEQITNPNWHGQATLRFGFKFLSGTTTTGSELDPGFALDDISVTGYTICSNTSNSITQSSCDQLVSPSGNYTWITSGLYNDTIPNAAGCDSVITIDLTIDTVDNSVTQTGTSLMSVETGAIYQWLDCDNAMAIVSGATSQTFNSPINGNFAVEVTQNGCTDTSMCYSVEGIGFEDLYFDQVQIYPNPTHDVVFFNCATDVELLDIQGKIIRSATNVSKLDLSGLNNGIYFLTVSNGEVFKLIKN